MGVDQGNTLHCVVSKFVDGKRRYIWIGTLDSFPELFRMIVHYKPRVCVIDGLPNTHNARDLAKRLPSVYTVYYGGKNKINKEAWTRDLERKEVKIPRTELMDETAHLWNMGDVLIEDHIPRSMIEDFADQMSNAKRTLMDAPDGQKKAVWIQVGDDHYRHADAYNRLALEIGNTGYNNHFAISQPDPLLFVGENMFTPDEIW